MQYLHDLLTMMQAYPTVFYIYVVILGLLVGSFLNVVIYRLPVMMENNFKDEFQEYFHPEQPLPKRERFNLMVPRSRCPNWGCAVAKGLCSKDYRLGKHSGLKLYFSTR